MDSIDAATAHFDRILEDVQSYGDTIFSEQDTRLKVINRVMHESLCWPYGEISTETRSGEGFIDYLFTINQRGRLVVEAKRDDRDLGVTGRVAGRPFKLNGAVFSNANAQEGIRQAIRYCGQKNAELACVTNGKEWVVFRGSRLGDGLDTTEGMAFVFPSLEEVRNHFSLFYDLISYSSVQEFKYRALFQEAEGIVIRPLAFRRSVRNPKHRRMLRQNPLGADLSRVMASFFERLTGDQDPGLLEKCFVVTRESSEADQTLARISEDLVATIKELDSESGVQLTEIIQRIRQTGRNEFVLLVGTKGAGKSTFIDRFFNYVLPKPIAAHCIVAKVNLARCEPSEHRVVDWLDRNLLSSLEKAVFGNEGPSFEDLTGMFYDEYRRLSTGAWRPIYDADYASFQLKFGEHIETIRQTRPHEYIHGIVRQIINSRKKVPCLVFDNADHFTIEFQERVFQYARTIYEESLCMVIMPVTDQTSWQLSREGALRSFESRSLYLPTPDPRKVLERRITYLEEMLETESRVPGRGYFVGRGIHVSIDNLKAFSAALQAVFLQKSIVARWIGALANQDIRRCLEIAQAVASSPHVEVADLVEAYVVGTALRVPEYRVLKALIRGRYDVYPGEFNPYVINVYSLVEETPSSPLMASRILQLLRDTRRANKDDKYISVDQVVHYFEAMQVESSLTLKHLSKLMGYRLCQSYDPTQTSVNEDTLIEITLSGAQHLSWSLYESNYILAMLEVTPILDESMFMRLSDLCGKPMGETYRERLRVFSEYLVSEDKLYCRVPDHKAYESQRNLSRGPRLGV